MGVHNGTGMKRKMNGTVVYIFLFVRSSCHQELSCFTSSPGLSDLICTCRRKVELAAQRRKQRAEQKAARRRRNHKIMSNSERKRRKLFHLEKEALQCVVFFWSVAGFGPWPFIHGFSPSLFSTADSTCSSHCTNYGCSTLPPLHPPPSSVFL